jgi:carbonic anhydrase
MPVGDALKALMEGNARYVAGDLAPRDLAGERAALVDGQSPKAAILSCSDSRVVPELIFDQGPGQLFAARVAGNVLVPAVLASLEFGVAFLGLELIVVMGHSSCQALKAAASHSEGGDVPSDLIAELLQEIQPAVARAKSAETGDLLENLCAENVRHQVARLRASAPVAGSGEPGVQVVGALYDLASGKVSLLDPPEA